MANNYSSHCRADLLAYGERETFAGAAGTSNRGIIASTTEGLFCLGSWVRTIGLKKAGSVVLKHKIQNRLVS